MHAIPDILQNIALGRIDPAQRQCLQVCQLCHVQIVSCAAAQVPHDQPLVAQAMIERWVNGALKGGSGNLKGVVHY
jgi:hypothetical protein